MPEIYFWIVSRAMYNQVTWNTERKLRLLIFSMDLASTI